MTCCGSPARGMVPGLCKGPQPSCICPIVPPIRNNGHLTDPRPDLPAYKDIRITRPVLRTVHRASVVLQALGLLP